jgi:ABC-2 type transport system ATP-binding protein
MLEFIDISKKFDADIFSSSFLALDEISFKVKKGAIVGFLGANGAGKTTSLKIAMDFIPATSGKVQWDEELGNNFDQVKSNLGFLPERPYFYPHLTGRELCIFLGGLNGLTKKIIEERVEKWAPRFSIDFALDRKINNYSKGMLQRLGFLVTLLHDPKFIILDEPLSGLDPIGRKDLKQVITEVNKEGKTVFFSSHIVSDVEEVCSDVIFIQKGKLIYQGKILDLIEKNKSRYSEIKYIESDKISTIRVEEESKQKVIEKLLNENNKIISVENEKLSLEEIIYEVR